MISPPYKIGIDLNAPWVDGCCGPGLEIPYDERPFNPWSASHPLNPTITLFGELTKVVGVEINHSSDEIQAEEHNI